MAGQLEFRSTQNSSSATKLDYTSPLAGLTGGVVAPFWIACRRASERLPRSSTYRGLPFLSFAVLTLICRAQNEQEEFFEGWGDLTECVSESTSSHLSSPK